jgi:hypothetical protein
MAVGLEPLVYHGPIEADNPSNFNEKCFHFFFPFPVSIYALPSQAYLYACKRNAYSAKISLKRKSIAQKPLFVNIQHFLVQYTQLSIFMVTPLC